MSCSTSQVASTDSDKDVSSVSEAVGSSEEVASSEDDVDSSEDECDLTTHNNAQASGSRLMVVVLDM